MTTPTTETPDAPPARATNGHAPHAFADAPPPAPAELEPLQERLGREHAQVRAGLAALDARIQAEVAHLRAQRAPLAAHAASLATALNALGVHVEPLDDASDDDPVAPSRAKRPARPARSSRPSRASRPPSAAAKPASRASKANSEVRTPHGEALARLFAYPALATPGGMTRAALYAAACSTARVTASQFRSWANRNVARGRLARRGTGPSAIYTLVRKAATARPRRADGAPSFAVQLRAELAKHPEGITMSELANRTGHVSPAARERVGGWLGSEGSRGSIVVVPGTKPRIYRPKTVA